MPSTTWALLLAHWTDFARSAVALPAAGEGGRLRAAVPSIIGLQAVTYALAALDALAPDEYAAAQDKAEVLLRRHAAELHAAWRGEPLPGGVADLLIDAHAALRATREGGVEFEVGAGVAAVELDETARSTVASRLVAASFAGDLWLVRPAVRMVAGMPCAFLRGPGGRPPGDEAAGIVLGLLPRSIVRRVSGMRQVYRTSGPAGPRDDAIQMDAALPEGMPLLVPVLEAGRPV